MLSYFIINSHSKCQRELELRPLKAIFVLAILSINWALIRGDGDYNLRGTPLERSDRLGFVRNERTDTLFELTDFKIKYYSLLKEFEELQENCEEAKNSNSIELNKSIQQNKIGLEILRVQVDQLMNTKTNAQCPAKTSHGYVEMEEKLNDLRWIKNLIEEYNLNLKNSPVQEHQQHQQPIDFERWLAQFQKVTNDFENQILRSPLSQEVAFGTLLDYYELRSLAYNLYEREKYIEAIGLFEMIYQRQNSTLGSENSKTLDTQHKLALCLDKLKEHTRALELLRRVYEKRVEILGPNHEVTLRAWQIMAWVLHNQGKCRESFNLYKSIYEKQAKYLGPHHPDTLHTKANMDYVAKELV